MPQNGNIFCSKSILLEMPFTYISRLLYKMEITKHKIFIFNDKYKNVHLYARLLKCKPIICKFKHNTIFHATMENCQALERKKV